MESLLHATDACTGNWRLANAVDERIIRCERCAVTYPATPGHRLAAIDENYAGIYLRRLAEEGEALRAEDRSE